MVATHDGAVGKGDIDETLCIVGGKVLCGSFSGKFQSHLMISSQNSVRELVEM